MTRTVNEERPGELLDAIVQYLSVHRIADLSLRPLATAVGSSPRGLLYYFGSKEKMVDLALARVRERQRAMYGELYTLKFKSQAAVYRAIWRHMTAAESEPIFRLFFEAYGMALREPKRFQALLRATIEDWLEFIADTNLKRRHGRRDARVFATILLAGYRGFMLDFCATHDRQRLNRAVNLWIQSLDKVPLKLVSGQ